MVAFPVPETLFATSVGIASTITGACEDLGNPKYLKDIGAEDEAKDGQ